MQSLRVLHAVFILMFTNLDFGRNELCGMKTKMNSRFVLKKSQKSQRTFYSVIKNFVSFLINCVMAVCDCKINQ